jgi:hypothetical protein
VWEDHLSKPNLAFAEAVNKVLADRNLHLRGAEYKTGLDHTTVNRMKNGLVPSRGKIIEWAEGLGESINHWLGLAGYDPIPENLVRDPAASYEATPTPSVDSLKQSGFTTRIVRSSGGDDIPIPVDANPPQEDIDRIADILRHGGDCVEEPRRA